MLGSTKWFGNYGADYIIFLIPKRLQKFLRRLIFQWKKIRSIFSRIIEFDEPHGTTYKGRQGLLTIFVQVIWSFRWDLGGRQSLFKEKLFFPLKKIGLLYLVLPSMADLRQHFLSCTRSSGNHCASEKILSVTPKRLLETNFWKKRLPFQWKKYLGQFFRFIEYDRHYGTNI